MDPALWAILGAVVGCAAAWSGLRLRHSRESGTAERELSVLKEALERQQRASEDTMEVRDVILSSMQDGVLLLDASGQTVFTNAALERHLDGRPDGTARLHPAAREAVARAAFTGAAHPALIEVSEPVRYLRLVAAPAGTDGAVLVVVSDVTEARKLEAIRTDFVANASHELKTPAASIRAAAETLRDAAAEDPEAARRFAGRLEADAVRLSRIVEDLLDLSRLESGSKLGERVDLSGVMREEADKARGAAAGAGVSLAIESAGAAPVLGSARDLALLVRNLIDNAIRYTDQGGSVRVSVVAQGDDVLLSVRDTGRGIPGEDLGRIFERFFRVDRARSRETGGTGLGLAIVKHVAENHGGSVAVESEPGRGTTFTVRLPRDGG